MNAQAMETEPQREPLPEIPLQGGRLTPGIVRIGDTVRRLPKGNAAFVHDLLLFLEDRGSPFAPRFLGRDEQDREILSYLEGKRGLRAVLGYPMICWRKRPRPSEAIMMSRQALVLLC